MQVFSVAEIFCFFQGTRFSMRRSDGVTDEQGADAWLKVIGQYGDPIRMTTINWIVAHVLNHFGGADRLESIAKPHSVILPALRTLPVAANEEIESQREKLIELHTNKSYLTEIAPKIANTSLLDLGSGNGYLGGWLSTYGVRYTGVEPSAALHQAAKRDERLSSATLVQSTIEDFCNNSSFEQLDAPTLISIIGVVDFLADPESTMRTLLDFLASQLWANVPILVATFDPDFFLPGLPISGDTLQQSNHYGVDETLRVRDPAVWESIFANAGFHLLEQRPLHLASLPLALSDYLDKLHKRLFPVVGSMAETEGYSLQNRLPVPPRQGPFYFWLICSRNAVIQRHTTSMADSPSEAPHPKPSHLETFNQDEVISVLGNLGANVYQVIDGSAYFDSAETGPMPFDKGSLFGQLEASYNYVSSRIVGKFIARKGTTLQVTNNLDVLRYLNKSPHLCDALFLSLLHHLDSVHFHSFYDMKRVKGWSQNSCVLIKNEATKRPTKYLLKHVQNISACLLQQSANSVPSAFDGSYRSRIFFELSTENLGRSIYGPSVNREHKDLYQIMADLVQANIIDNFSPSYLKEDLGQKSVTAIEGEVDPNLNIMLHNPLNFGWQAARFVFHHFPQPNEFEQDEKFTHLALTISAFFKHTGDEHDFKRYLKESKDPSFDFSVFAKKEKVRSRHYRNYILSQVLGDKRARDRLDSFLVRLYDGFCIADKNRDYSKKHGLSNFFVVRDVWALLGCLLNDESIWNTRNLEFEIPPIFISKSQQEPRIIAYIQECIRNVGNQTGFDGTPW